MPSSANEACERVDAIKERLAELLIRESEQRRQIAESEACLATVVQEIEVAEAELEAAITAPVAGEEDPTLWLPDELVLAILLRVVYIGACASVCRRWNALCQSTEVKQQRWALRWGDYATERLAPQAYLAHSDNVQALAVSPGGNTLYTACAERNGQGMIKRWNGLERVSPGSWLESSSDVVAGQGILALAADADGWVFMSSDNGVGCGHVMAFSGETGNLKQAYHGHSTSVSSLSVADGRLFGAFDTKIIQWDCATGETRCLFEGHKETVLCIALGNDKLFSGSSDGTIRAWSTVNGAHLQTTGHDDGEFISTIAVGRDILVSGSNCSLSLWSVHDGKLLRQIRTRASVMAVALSPNNTLFSVEFDDWVHVRRNPFAKTDVVTQFRPQQFRVGTRMALAPNGTLFTTTYNRAVYVL